MPDGLSVTEKQNAAYLEAQRRIAKEKQKKTGRLHLDGLRLGMLPEQVWEMTWLMHLDADHCRLNSLPKEIGHLTNLRELYLHDNGLTELPESRK